MNNSRPNDVNDVLQWSRRRWMGSAIGAALPSLVMEPEVQAAVVNQATVVPASGPVVWSRIPDPTNPGKFVASSMAGGMLVSIPFAGRGERHVTWTIKNLTPGYYRVRLQYPKHSGNAPDILVQKKTSKDAAFVNWKVGINQRFGDGAKTLSNSFAHVSKDITPYATSNAASYIWVDQDPGATKGTLQIRVSDWATEGWLPKPIGSRMVADTVVVDLMGTVK